MSQFFLICHIFNKMRVDLQLISSVNSAGTTTLYQLKKSISEPTKTWIPLPKPFHHAA